MSCLDNSGTESGFRLRIPEILTTGPQKETHLFESDFICLWFAFFLVGKYIIILATLCPLKSQNVFQCFYCPPWKQHTHYYSTTPECFSESINKNFPINKWTHTERNKKQGATKNAQYWSIYTSLSNAFTLLLPQFTDEEKHSFLKELSGIFCIKSNVHLMRLPKPCPVQLEKSTMIDYHLPWMQKEKMVDHMPSTVFVPGHSFTLLQATEPRFLLDKQLILPS